MEKLTIQNRKGQNIAVLLEKSDNQKGLAFVMHGLGGFKEQDHISVFADSFREHGYTVVRFDTTNTLGESDGNYEDATITNYYEDLEDVIEWASGEEWYQEPFMVNGHSLGGICTTLFAEKYPEKVKGLVPISSVVSGKLSIDAHQERNPEELQKWEESGWRITESASKPGVMKKLKWSHMEDRLKHDVLQDTSKLTMPVILIVGEEDPTTPPKHQQIFLDAISHEKKELHVIKGAPHTFRTKKHLDEIKSIFDTWLDTYC